MIVVAEPVTAPEVRCSTCRGPWRPGWTRTSRRPDDETLRSSSSWPWFSDHLAYPAPGAGFSVSKKPGQAPAAPKSVSPREAMV